MARKSLKAFACGAGILLALSANSHAQVASDSKQGAQIAGSFAAVADICGFTLTAKARRFALEAERLQPKHYQAASDSEGHGMTFYTEENCLSVWEEYLGPRGENSMILGFTIAEEPN